MNKRFFFEKVLWVLNIVLALFLFIAGVMYYVAIESLSFLSILSLSVPVLLGLHLLFMVYWLFRNRRYALLSASFLILSYIAFGNFYEIKLKTDTVAKEDLSIMSFNSRVFNRNEDFDDSEIPQKIVAFIEDNDPDILCFQEFEYHYGEAFKQYPFSYISYEGLGERVLQAIFSKYPIIDSASLNFPKTGNNGIFADIKYQKDTLRVYNLHMESLKIRPNAAAIAGESSDKLFKRLNKSFGKQQVQAELYKKHGAKTSYPKIICGDFNNTQFSNVYRTIRGDLQDTFRKKGEGFGRTFDFMGVPMRIDFILVDKRFQVMTHRNYEVFLSDHFPIMSSVRLMSKP